MRECWTNTRKGHGTRVKLWYRYCRDGGFLDLHPYPATRVHNCLGVDLDRNVAQGDKGIKSNVQDTLGSLRNLLQSKAGQHSLTMKPAC